MSNAVPVSASTWVPISAYYPYDENIEIQNSYIQWEDGYKAFDHNAFKAGVDYSINRDTILYLPSAKNLFSFISDLGLADVHQGAYISLSINSTYFTPSTQYVTVVGSDLYLNSLSGDGSFFRFMLNDNGTFSLFCSSGLYVTVDDTTPFNLTLQQKLAENELYMQEFNWNEYNNKMYFTSKTKNPTYPIGPEYEERLWSFSKVGPEKGRMRANGILPFSDYLSAGDIYKNDYLFDITEFVIFYPPKGLVTEHTWVRYYNEFDNKTHNRDTEIFEQKSISGVFINHLFDLPYNTKISIDNKAMAVNLANLKNVMTGEYEYRTKK